MAGIRHGIIRYGLCHVCEGGKLANPKHQQQHYSRRKAAMNAVEHSRFFMHSFFLFL